jgi:hypothetical protein
MRSAATLVTATMFGAAMASTALASADPVYYNGSARSIVNSLQADGYNVVINWQTGYGTKSLDVCWVTNVDNPDSSPPAPGAFTTVYVDVSCPNHDYD